jgi:hypothetical protein
MSKLNIHTVPKVDTELAAILSVTAISAIAIKLIYNAYGNNYNQLNDYDYRERQGSDTNSSISDSYETPYYDSYDSDDFDYIPGRDSNDSLGNYYINDELNQLEKNNYLGGIKYKKNKTYKNNNKNNKKTYKNRIYKYKYKTYKNKTNKKTKTRRYLKKYKNH